MSTNKITDTNLTSSLLDGMKMNLQSFLKGIEEENLSLESNTEKIKSHVNLISNSYKEDFFQFKKAYETFVKAVNKKKRRIEIEKKRKEIFSKTELVNANACPTLTALQNINQETQIFNKITSDSLNLINSIEKTRSTMLDIVHMVEKSRPKELKDSLALGRSLITPNTCNGVSTSVSITNNVVNNFTNNPNDMVKSLQNPQKPKKYPNGYSSLHYINKLIDVTKVSPEFEYSVKSIFEKMRKHFIKDKQNVEDMLFNKKYDHLFNGLTHNDYYNIAKEVKKELERCLGKIYKAYNLSIILEKIRFKYTSVICIDFLSEYGTYYEQVFYKSFKRQYVKLTCVSCEDHVDPKMLKRILKFFPLYYYKVEECKLIVYGWINFRNASIIKHFGIYSDRLLKYFLKMKMKYFLFEGDWIKPFVQEGGFTHNLEEDFINSLEIQMDELNFTREVFAKVVLNFVFS